MYRPCWHLGCTFNFNELNSSLENVRRYFPNLKEIRKIYSHNLRQHPDGKFADIKHSSKYLSPSGKWEPWGGRKEAKDLQRARQVPRSQQQTSPPCQSIMPRWCNERLKGRDRERRRRDMHGGLHPKSSLRLLDGASRFFHCPEDTTKINEYIRKMPPVMSC